MSDTQDKNSQLFTEFEQQRNDIKKMVEDLESLKENVMKIFPKTLDNRNKFLFEEKIKTASSLFSTLLDMRKEVMKSVKDEIEMRRKIKSDERGGDDLEGMIDVRAIVESIKDEIEERS